MEAKEGRAELGGLATGGKERDDAGMQTLTYERCMEFAKRRRTERINKEVMHAETGNTKIGCTEWANISEETLSGIRDQRVRSNSTSRHQERSKRPESGKRDGCA